MPTLTDINGDGRDDIVWTNAATGQARISLSTGAGFAAPTTVGPTLGAGWRLSATGDFDADGKTDFIWQDRNGQAAVWLMDGYTVKSATNIGAARGSNWVVRAAGDFNGDGKDDIVWQDHRGQAEVWTMNGAIVGAMAAAGPPATGYLIMGVDDIGGDGHASIMWQTNAFYETVYFFNGTALSSAAQWAGQGRVAGLADVDGDGRADVINVLEGNNATSFTLTRGRGTNYTDWETRPIASSNTITAHVHGVGDYNGDGATDLLWEDATTGLTEVWTINNAFQVIAKTPVADPGLDWVAGIQPWEPIAPPPVSPASLRNDFNADGVADILWQSSNGEAVLWLMGGQFKSTVVASTLVGGAHNGPNWRVMASGDVNADGKTDFVWENVATGQAVVWTMDGLNVTGAAAIGVANTAAYQVKALGDLTGDGRDDVIWQNVNTGQAVLWEMHGTNVVSGVYIAGPQGNAWKVVGTADIDDDGKSDLIWRNDDSGMAVAWLMDGSTIRDAYALGTGGPSWHIQAFGDFDRDGTEDIFWENHNDGRVVVWMMKDGHISSSVAMEPEGTQWQLRGYMGETDDQSMLLWEDTSNGQAAIFYYFGTANNIHGATDPVGLPSGTNFTLISDF